MKFTDARAWTISECLQGIGSLYMIGEPTMQRVPRCMHVAVVIAPRSAAVWSCVHAPKHLVPSRPTKAPHDQPSNHGEDIEVRYATLHLLLEPDCKTHPPLKHTYARPHHVSCRRKCQRYRMALRAGPSRSRSRVRPTSGVWPPRHTSVHLCLAASTP